MSVFSRQTQCYTCSNATAVLCPYIHNGDMSKVEAYSKKKVKTSVDTSRESIIIERCSGYDPGFRSEAPDLDKLMMYFN